MTQGNLDIYRVKGSNLAHRAGDVYSPNTPVAEVMVNAGHDFLVRLEETVWNGIAVPSTFTVLKDTGEIVEPLTTVGSRYTPLQNTPVYEIAEAGQNAGWLEVDSAGTVDNGGRCWLMMTLAGVEARITHADGRMDNITPNIFFSMNHLGSGHVEVGMSAINPNCNNQLQAIIQGLRMRVKIRHTRAGVEKLEMARDIVQTMTNSYESFTGILQGLAEMRMSPGEFQTFAATWLEGYRGPAVKGNEKDDYKVELALTKRERTIAELSRLYVDQSVGNLGEDRADAYGAVTDYLDHHRERYNQSVDYAKLLLNNQGSNMLGPISGKTQALAMLRRN